MAVDVRKYNLCFSIDVFFCVLAFCPNVAAEFK